MNAKDASLNDRDAEWKALDRALYEEISLKQLDDGRLVASSYSTPSQVYVLHGKYPDWRCECPAGRYGRMCKHLALARAVHRLEDQL